MFSLPRFTVTAALLALAAAAPHEAGAVVRERLRDDIDLSYHSAIAVGSDGVVHRAWREGDGKDPTSVLMYARGELGDWTTEVVDTREPAFKSDDIAVDSMGRVHLSYYWNNREDPDQPRFSVVHAVREAEGWVHTTLASPDVLSSTTCAVGPDGNPRVAWLGSLDEDFHSGPAIVASFDGAAWTLAEMPVPGTPNDLKVDAEGRAHLVVHGSDHSHYLTDASGAWAEEVLPVELSLASLAIGGDGRVHVAGFVPGQGGAQAILHLVRERGTWSVDSTLGDDGGDFRREMLHLVAGPGRELHILFAEQLQETWDGNSDRWRFFFDGRAWTRESFATREDSAEINAAAVGPDGILHVICAGREAPWVDYFRFGGPEMEVDTSALRVVRRRDGFAVKGRLRIRNLDSLPSGERTLRFARADRDEYRPGDPLLGRERRVRPLRAGARRSIPVSVPIPDPSPEDRLLVLVDRVGAYGIGTRVAEGAFPLER